MSFVLAINFLIMGIQIVAGLTVTGLAIAGVNEIRKSIVINRTRKSAKKLNKALSKKKRNIKLEKKLLKKYTKNRLKCAKLGIVLGSERGITYSNVRNKKLSKQMAKNEIAESKLILSRLKGKNKKAGKYESLLNELKANFIETKDFVQNIGGVDVKNPTKSIYLNGKVETKTSNFIENRYVNAVNGFLASSYAENRGRLKTNNPIITDVYDDNGNVIHHLSDTSPRRAQEFSGMIFAHLYNDALDRERRNLPVQYRAVSFDTFEANGKNEIVEKVLTSSQQIKEHYLKKVVPLYVGLSDDSKFKAEYFLNKGNFEKKFDQYVETLNYVEQSSLYGSDNLKSISKKLETEFEKINKDSTKYPVSTKFPIYTKICDNNANGKEFTKFVTTSETKRKDLMVDIMAQACAYAKFKEDNHQKVDFKLETVRYDATNQLTERRSSEQARFQSSNEIAKYAVNSLKLTKQDFDNFVTDYYNEIALQQTNTQTF